MINDIVKNNLDKIYKSCLIVDIETSAHYSNGQEINIKTNYEDYLEHAKVKWVGFYSFNNNQYYLLDAQQNVSQIMDILNSHSVLVGFNSTDFDIPILDNNGLLPDKRYNQIDCMVTLGTPNRKTRSGYSFKNRGDYMKFKFKNNSLRHMAEVMKLSVSKGEIDYRIFHKDVWTIEEQKEIKTYLHDDIQTTKEMFDKLWDFWLPFTAFIDEKYIYDLSWIKNSIASLTYKSACKVLEVEPTYSDNKSAKEDMGARVIDPKYEEAYKVYYVDFASLYPHIFSMFNLFSEVDKYIYPNAWHGSEMFKVKGYYDISKWNPLSRDVAEKLKMRMNLKAINDKDPMVYALKILLNSLYGTARSGIFEKVHTENCGWDCCWLGQQIHEYTEQKLIECGFEIIYGDTDSLMIIPTDEEFDNIDYVKDCLNQIVKEIKENCPFPVDTFKIDIEHYIKYMLFPFSLQEQFDENGNKIKIKNRLVKKLKGKKKNYFYLYDEDGETKHEIMGLPIKKDNATPLSMMIFKNELIEEIKRTNKGKFPKEFIDNLLQRYLSKKDVLASLAREYRVQPFETYKNKNQLQAQISKEYCNCDSGVVRVIKNKTIGRVGKSAKYCTIEEAINNNLTVDELDLEKTYKELDPFIIREPIKEKEYWVKNIETNVEYLVTSSEYLENKEILELINKPKKAKT